MLGEFNLNIKPKKRPRQRETKRYKILIERLKDAKTNDQYQYKIKKKLLGRTRTNEIEDLWSNYKEAILESANESCGKKAIGGTNRRTAWWNDQIKLKVKQKKEAWKKYLLTRAIDDLQQYKKLTIEAKNEVRLSKQNQWEEFGNKLEHNFRENQKLFWGAVKRCRRENKCPTRHVKDKNGEIIKENEKILEVWKDYFQNLHNSNTNSETDRDSEYQCNDTNSEKETEDEVTMVD